MTLDVSTEVNALFRQKALEFIEWCEANWKIKPEDRDKDEWMREKSSDYADGYNAFADGLKGAFECWNEEFNL